MNINNIITYLIKGGNRMDMAVNEGTFFSINSIFIEILIFIIINFIKEHFFSSDATRAENCIRQNQIGDVSHFIINKDRYGFHNIFFNSIIFFLVRSSVNALFRKIGLNINMSIIIQSILITIYAAFYISGTFRYPPWPFDFPPGWKETANSQENEEEA